MDGSKKVDLAKLRSISVAASAVPSRSVEVAQKELDQKQFAKDAAAYRRLRKDGLQPRRVDGCAEVEKRAETATQVERFVHLGGPRAVR